MADAKKIQTWADFESCETPEAILRLTLYRSGPDQSGKIKDHAHFFAKLKDCASLRDFRLYGDNAGEFLSKDFDELFTILPNLPLLSVMRLIDLNLEFESLDNLCQMLPSFQSLAVLSLSDNVLGDHGIIRLCKTLPSIPLVELYLSNTDFGLEGLTLLCSTLPSVHALHVLGIDGNNLGDAGIDVLCPFLVSVPQLKALWLQKTGITDQGAEKLIQTIKSYSSIACDYIDLLPNPMSISMSEHVIKALVANRQYAMLVANEGTVPVKKCCMVVCGRELGGKTTLIHSLRKNWGKLYPQVGEEAGKSAEPSRTPGIAYTTISLNNGSELIVMDFAGQVEYYVTHEMFLNISNGFFVLVVNLALKPHARKAHIVFWLRLLQAKFTSASNHRPDIVIVGSHLDSFSNTKASWVKIQFEEECSRLKEAFGAALNIQTRIYSLDCRDSTSNSLESLRDNIEELSAVVMQRQPLFPKCCETLSAVVSLLRLETESYGFPPLSRWEEFVDRAQRFISVRAARGQRHASDLEEPVSEENLLRMAIYLSQLGDLVFFPEMSASYQCVFLSPNWLAHEILGVALASEAITPHLIYDQHGDVRAGDAILEFLESVHTLPSSFTLETFCELIFDLLQQLEICFLSSPEADSKTEVSPLDRQYLFPSMMRSGIPNSKSLQWGEDDGSCLHFGVRYACDFITPGIFPHIVVRLRKKLSQNLVLWQGGLQCAVSGVECMVECGHVPLDAEDLDHCLRFIDIRVRPAKGILLNDDIVFMCHRVLDSVCVVIEEVRLSCSPGCPFERQALSPLFLLEKIMEQRKAYPLRDILNKKPKETISILGACSETVGDIAGLPLGSLATLSEMCTFVKQVNGVIAVFREFLSFISDKDKTMLPLQAVVEPLKIELSIFDNEDFASLAAVEKLISTLTKCNSQLSSMTQEVACPLELASLIDRLMRLVYDYSPLEILVAPLPQTKRVSYGEVQLLKQDVAMLSQRVGSVEAKSLDEIREKIKSLELAHQHDIPLNTLLRELCDLKADFNDLKAISLKKKDIKGVVGEIETIEKEMGEIMDKINYFEEYIASIEQKKEDQQGIIEELDLAVISEKECHHPEPFAVESVPSDNNNHNNHNNNNNNQTKYVYGAAVAAMIGVFLYKAATS